MPAPPATKAKTNGKPGPKHNIDAVREAFYERISKRDMAPLWKVMSSVVTKEPVTRVAPHVWRYSDVKALVMESGGLITRRGGQAPRADPRESRDARRVEGDQHAVRRHPDDPAGRGRAGAPPRLVGDPLRARRRGRLHRGRGREGVHVARRLRHHRQLGAARPRQPVEEADAVARRARFPGGEFLRGVVRGLLLRRRQQDAEDDARRRQLRGVLRARACCRTARRPRSTAAR